MFPRMVIAAPGRIVAVIRGDDRKIVGAQRGLDLGQPRVEGFEAGGVTGDIAAVAVFGVEIDEIDEDKPAVVRCLQRLHQQVDMFRVRLALQLEAGVAMGEDVADLANRHDRPPCRRRSRKQIAGQRRNREILAVGGAREGALALAEKGSGDNAANVEGIAKPTRDAAEVIEAFETEGLFMRGDLQDRIRRRVADRLQRPQMLLAEFLYDLRA